MTIEELMKVGEEHFIKPEGLIKMLDIAKKLEPDKDCKDVVVTHIKEMMLPMKECSIRTLVDLHKAYMKSKEMFDNYNYDDSMSSTDYVNNGEDVVELDTHWYPVARDEEFDRQMEKLRQMKEINSR